MPAFTSFLNLYKPGGGSTGTITPDEVADIDRLNANFDLIDDFASSVDGWQTARGDLAERNQQFYGTAAAKASVTGMKLGDTYQETDGSKFTWKYDGANWLLALTGIYKIIPTSVVGGSVSSDGSIDFNTGTGTLSVNGVFSSLFSSYDVVWYHKTATAQGAAIKMRSAGVDFAGSNWFYSLDVRPGTAVSAGNSLSLPLSNAGALHHTHTLLFHNPFEVEITTVTGLQTAYNSGQAYSIAISGQHAVSQSFDGFTINDAANFTAGRMEIYGRA